MFSSVRFNCTFDSYNNGDAERRPIHAMGVSLVMTFKTSISDTNLDFTSTRFNSYWTLLECSGLSTQQHHAP